MLPFLLLCCGAASLDSAGTAAPSVDHGASGPYDVARTTVEVVAGDRRLPVEVWAPALAPTQPQAITVLAVDQAQREVYQALLDAAPAGCPARETVAGPGALAEGPWPLVLASHCHGCTRYSGLTVAAHLASHGMVVAAPDHVGNTLYDELAGAGLPLDVDTLALRVGDLQAVRDAALAGGLGVSVDPDRVAVFGHSFGAVTAGKLLQDELGRAGGPVAGLFVGAPVDNPLLAGVDAAALDAPTLFLLLEEDHSIGLPGNLLIEGNHAEVPGPSWLVRMADGGHWSPSDLVGLTEGFMPGCGEDERQDGGEPFTYVAPEVGRSSTAAVASAFFSASLGLDPEAAAWLADSPLAGLDITTP